MIVDVLASMGLQRILRNREPQSAYRGYKIYNKFSDLYDIGKAVVESVQLAVALYQDASSHAGKHPSQIESEFEDMMFGEANFGTSGVAMGVVASSANDLLELLRKLLSNDHHIATDKHTTKWTPEFEKLFRKAGIGLNHPDNKVSVFGHKGRHPEEYHKEVFRRLSGSVQGLRAFQIKL